LIDEGDFEMKNAILDAVHQTAIGLRKSDAITDVTMSESNGSPSQ
jgi:hypothetical protein